MEHLHGLQNTCTVRKLTGGREAVRRGKQTLCLRHQMTVGWGHLPTRSFYITRASKKKGGDT